MEATGELDLGGAITSTENSLAPGVGTAPSTRPNPTGAAPSVVAVVVTRDPGPSLDDTLASLIAQDHEALSILVIDDGSAESVFDRVAAAAPGAYVRRFERSIGYGAAANIVTEMVQGATYYLFCHDDVALAPDAVRLLSLASTQQGASLAAPKLVSWDDHERFLSLGYAIDRSGLPVPLVELDDLDQGQHDQIREVTAAHGATLLVDADVFTALGGFLPSLTDPATGTTPESLTAPGPDLGEDLDLCLRARRRGHKVIVVPAARVAHQSVLHGVAGPLIAPQPTDRRRPPHEPAPLAEQRLLRDRNRIRSMVATAGATRLVILVPLLVLQALRHGAPAAEAMVGRRRTPFTALRLALASRNDRRQARTHGSIVGVTVPDELGSELVPVSTRLRAELRSDVSADSARLWRAAERALGSRRGGRFAFGTLAFVLAVIVFGSRGLIGSGIGRGGRLIALPPLGDLWRLVTSGWQETGLGHFGPTAPGVALLAIASTLALGATGVVGTLVGLGPFALGAIGMYRSTGTTDPSGRSVPHRSGVALAAVVVYLIVPIPFDALSLGDRGALWGYALLPWLFRPLERLLDSRVATVSRADASGQLEHTEGVDARPTALRRSRLRSLLGFRLGDVAQIVRPALVLAVAVAMDPTFTVVWVQTVVLFAVGSLLTGGVGAFRRIAARGLLVAGAALVLLAPWVISLARSGAAGWSFTGGEAARSAPLRIDQLLRLETGANGPIGTAVLGGLFVLAAAFVLFVADGARLLLAIRNWIVVIGSVLLAWLAGRGWLPPVLPGPALTLLPAAYCIARLSGEGLGALVGEVRRRGFGWRQAFAAIGLLSVGLSVLPIATASASGRWARPERTPADKLAWMRGLKDGGFRVAFVGDPRVLPGSPLRLASGLGTTITRDGLPTIADQWVVNETARTRAFADALSLARLGATTRLGAELAPLGIRFLVIVERDRSNGPRLAVPADLRQSLLEQLDLRAVDSGTDLIVYENDAWVPAVWSPLTSPGLERDGTVNTAGASSALLPVPLVASPRVSADTVPLDALRLRPPSSSFRGFVEADAEVIASLPASRYWRLTVGTASVKPVRLRGLIDAAGVERVGAPFSGFAVPRTGEGTLRPMRPWSVTLALFAAALAWTFALVIVGVDRHRRHLLLPDRPGLLPDVDPTADTDDDFDALALAFVDDEFADDDFVHARPAVTSAAVASAGRPTDVPDEVPADGSVADELWSRFSSRRAEADRKGDSDREDDPAAGRPASTRGPGTRRRRP